MDSYYRGDKATTEFAKKLRAGGNDLVAATASGKLLAPKIKMRLQRQHLALAVREFNRLPNSDRQPKLDPIDSNARNSLPELPKNGLILRGHCTYLKESRKGQIQRANLYYYEENPDRWPAETQSDTLWMKEHEWKSLIPSQPKEGDKLQVPQGLQNRFFGTLGIEYMEGSVRSMLPTNSRMTLTVVAETPKFVKFRLEGEATMGKRYVPQSRDKPDSRGCRVRILGFVKYDNLNNKITRFDVVGLGKAWGQLGNGQSEVRKHQHPWTYGIVWEAVRGETAFERIPPYNLLHYASFPYWGKK